MSTEDEPKSIWRLYLDGIAKANAEADAAPKMRPPVLTEFKSHDHEVYQRMYRKDLDEHGRIDELTVANADSFWPKDKLVEVGKNKKGQTEYAPRPWEGNAERKEFLRRLRSERGWTFAEVNGT